MQTAGKSKRKIACLWRGITGPMGDALTERAAC
jgi:hypothetical protein